MKRPSPRGSAMLLVGCAAAAAAVLPAAADPIEERVFARVEVQDTAIYVHQSIPIVVEILPFPEERRPNSFLGALGQFEFQAEISEDQLTVGQPITLTMKIHGRGNLDAVSAPKPEEGDGIKRYETRLIESDIDESRTYGTKVFEQVLIPGATDVTGIPAVEFSFFDPEMGEYKTLRKGPFPVVVKSDPAMDAILAEPQVPSAPGAVQEEDIVYLKKWPARWRRVDGARWYRHPAFITAQGIPPALGLIELVLAGRRRRLELDALWSALNDYFVDRLDLDPGDVASDTVVGRLRVAGMAEEDVQGVQLVFELCEQARFGFGFSSQPAMTDSDYRNALVIAEKLDDMILRCEEIGDDT